MNTKKLKQLVLDLAIHGKLVPQDPNDEPASELLKRIQADVETRGRASNKSKGKKSAVSSVDLEVPFEVPEGWCWCYSGEIAYIASGSTPSKECFVEEGIPYLKMYNLRNQKIDFEYHPQYITPEIHNGKLARSRTEVGDIIMNIVGPPLGKLAIIPAYLEEANFNQAAVLIRPLVEKDIIAKYLFYYLSEMSEINSIVTKGTAGQENISLTQSQHLRIPLPPLAEQHRIVAAIEKWFAIIDQLEKNEADLKKSIEQTKKKVLDLAIRGKLVAQNPEDEPAGELLARIRADVETHGRASNKAKGKKSAIPSVDLDEVPFEVPAGWEWCRLGTICDIFTGNSINESEKTNRYTNVEGMEYIATKDLDFDSKIDYSNGVNIPLECVDKFKVAPSGSILLCIEGGSAGRKIGLLDRDVCFVNKLCCFNSIKHVNNYLFYYLQSTPFKGIFEDSKSGLIGGVSVNALKTLPIPLPPLAEQKRIVAKVEEVFGVLERIEGMM